MGALNAGMKATGGMQFPQRALVQACIFTASKGTFHIHTPPQPPHRYARFPARPARPVLLAVLVAVGTHATSAAVHGVVARYRYQACGVVVVVVKWRCNSLIEN